MITVAAVLIVAAAVETWLSGLHLANLGGGTVFIFAAAMLNAGLGWYLVRTGRRNSSLILEANGKHVLTDSWTSFGVVAGLCLVLWTGWKPFDPLCAIAVALNILWSGASLLRRSIGGLMDVADPRTGRLLRQKLDAVCVEIGLNYHGVRFRHTGNRLLAEVHLLFPRDLPVGEAHRLATLLEELLPATMGMPTELITHLEALEDHGDVHKGSHYTGKPT
jgi:cation diffusion facilitator family transporter